MGSVSPGDLVLSPLFGELDDADREVVAHWLEAEPVSEGQRLTHEGASGYAFYVLVSGSADVILHGESVATLGRGDFFGEIAILDEGRQTATVQMTTPGEVWSMFGTRFRELQMQYPRIAEVIQRTARARMDADAD
jgi:CRP-like cAMP-binding protein